jgi:hypothetical protein
VQNKANLQKVRIGTNCGLLKGLWEEDVRYGPAKTKPIRGVEIASPAFARAGLAASSQ